MFRFVRLRHFSRQQARAAKKLAYTWVAENSDGGRALGARLRADEETRLIFAVFYAMPDRHSRPAPYKLVAVDPVAGLAEEITPPRESPYWLRNYK